jgi:hypothetical protein
MKKTIILILSVVTLSSCYQQVWEATITHSQVMSGYNSKEMIISKFGLPTAKKSEGEYEEWLYDYGTQIITDSQSNSAARVNSYGAFGSNSSTSFGYNSYNNPTIAGSTNGGYGANAYGNASTNSRQVVKEHKSYIKFTLKGNSVVKWESNGVNYGKYSLVKKKVKVTL